MTRPELKTRIVKHLLGYLTVKPFIELDDKVADFYDTEGGRAEVSAALDEVYAELKERYSDKPKKEIFIDKNKRNEILEWAQKSGLSAHDVFDEMNDSLKVIHCFYAEECPKDESGIVLSLHDAELLAYEYGRRLKNNDQQL